MIAQGLAAKRPDLVRALILCDTGHKIGTPDMWDARIAAIQEQGIAAISDAILERWFTPAYRSAVNADFIGYRLMLERTPVEGYTGTCAAIRDSDFTGSSATLAGPGDLRGRDRGRIDPAIAGWRIGPADPGGDVSGNPEAAHLPCIEAPVVNLQT
jgi:3-oxoadipate enol-lactonase